MKMPPRLVGAAVFMVAVKPKIMVIIGPTASGKTDLGIFLAKKFRGEIINADSRQIYREIDIATAKPIFEIQKLKIKMQNDNAKFKSFDKQLVIDGVPHHLFNIASPKKVVSVALWKKRAVKSIKDILGRGKLPIVVGGTGLYIQALVENLSIPSVPPNKLLRAKLEKEISQRGIEYVYKKLLRLDPEAIHIVQPGNPRRIIRAIEVCLVTHKPFTSQRISKKSLFDFLKIGINQPRQKLYSNIDKRVDWQFANGLIEETKKLIKKYDPHLPSMSGIGYKEVAGYLSGSLTLDEARQKIKYRTHDYARRQLVWFRRDNRIKWVQSNKKAEQCVKLFLSGV